MIINHAGLPTGATVRVRVIIAENIVPEMATEKYPYLNVLPNIPII